MKTLLEARHITKKFPGVTALKDVNLQLEGGKVMALIGENGAGKSTLLKIMSGIYIDFEGSIWFKGQEAKFSSPRDAQDLGISIIHQELNLIPYLTVAQNIFLGRELISDLGFLDEESMNQKTKELLDTLQMNVDPITQVNTLKVGQQQVVEIAKALLTESEVVFMDEPTSAIGDQEAELLFRIIERLKSEGKCIVYISHKLDELFTIADDFVVLRDGMLIGKGKMNKVSREKIIEMMAGRQIHKVTKAGKKNIDKELLKVQNLVLHNPENPGRPILDHISFQVSKGEVLGIYGLMGTGRTELFESLFGLHYRSLEGVIIIEGKEIEVNSVGAAIEAGMALVPEDRKQDGIIPGMSVAENMSITVLNKILRLTFLSKKKENQLYDRHVRSLRIKSNSANQLIKNLSGGNQQKVVLAKWIELAPKLLMLDEPTRGIDVNAKKEIYELIAELARSGRTILVASSEIPEIMEIADRILVMSEGRITAEFKIDDATENKIMNACIPEKMKI